MIEKLLEFRFPYLAGLALVAALAAFLAAQVEVEQNNESMNSLSGEELAAHDALREVFGEDEDLIVAYRSPALRTEAGVRALAELTTRFQAIAGVRRVYSLTNAVELVPGRDGTEERALLPPSGAPDFNQDPDGFNDGLSEYSNFGATDYGGVQRVFAGLLSGKDISSNSFSGVAWLSGYCSNNFGYSHNRIGSASFITPAFIAGGFGHEIGHNLGSSHTHCERLASGGTDFVDHCYAREGNGCYDGPTACPAGMAGSLMSYCHAPSSGFDGGGPAEGPPMSCSSSDSFHPLIIGKISGLITANNPSCIADFVDLGIIYLDGFEG